jgi:OOP family OmpA-OmpF porin
MTSNVLDLINDNISSDVVSKLAGFLGESPKSISSALNNAIPSLLAGLVNKGTDIQGANSIFSLLNQRTQEGDLPSNLDTAFSGGEGTNRLLSMGSNLLNSIFGPKTDSVASLITNTSGISKTSSNSLLKLLMPIILAVLGKTVRSEGITSAAGLANFLRSQGDFLRNRLPAGFSNIFGRAPLISESAKKTYATSPQYVAEEEREDSGKFWPWFLMLLLLAFLGWVLFKNFGTSTTPAPDISTPKAPPPVVSVPQVTAPDVSAPPVAAPETSMPKLAAPDLGKVGDFFEKTLSTGFTIKAAKDSIESKLVAFLEDTDRAVDKNAWFTMDGITFATGKATLSPESTKQVTNIAEILKAFPNAELKIGGYTDNTGSAKANLALSGQRASAVKNALTSMGIDASRLDSEGYGSAHPVTTNETEEGRQQNRRIDVQVTQK